MARNGDRFTTSDERPSQRLVSEICRNHRRENASLAAGQEMGGLSPIGRPRIEPVIRTGRDVRLFFVVPVEISPGQTERAVGVLKPSFKGGRHTLANVVRNRYIPYIPLLSTSRGTDHHDHRRC